jgi:hypothetical protein
VQGQWLSVGNGVTFRLRYVECPDLAPLFEHVGPDLRVVGQVVCLSDSGERKDHFAIVDVEGMYTPLIVPAARLRPATRPARRAAARPNGIGRGPDPQHSGTPAGEDASLQRLDP